MRTKNRFSTQHVLTGKEVEIYVTLEWDYYPGVPATYHEPEEHEFIELARIHVPDYLESRREEVKWLVEDEKIRLEDEAIEQIHNIFQRWREPNEYD